MKSFCDWFGVSLRHEHLHVLAVHPRYQSHHRFNQHVSVKLHVEPGEDLRTVCEELVDLPYPSRPLVCRVDWTRDLACSVEDLKHTLGARYKTRHEKGRLTWAVRGEVRRRQLCIYDKGFQLNGPDGAGVHTRVEVRVGADWLTRWCTREIFRTPEKLDEENYLVPKPTFANEWPMIRGRLEDVMVATCEGISLTDDAPFRERRAPRARIDTATHLARAALTTTDEVLADRLAREALALNPALGRTLAPKLLRNIYDADDYQSQAVKEVRSPRDHY